MQLWVDDQINVGVIDQYLVHLPGEDVDEGADWQGLRLNSGDA
jgi:hypothetical protein